MSAPELIVSPAVTKALYRTLKEVAVASKNLSKTALLKFVGIRNESGFTSNLQFSFDAATAGIDLDLLGDARKAESGGYEWQTPHGLLVEHPDGQMELLA